MNTLTNSIPLFIIFIFIYLYLYYSYLVLLIILCLFAFPVSSICFIDVRLLHLNKDYLLPYLLT